MQVALHDNLNSLVKCNVGPRIKKLYQSHEMQLWQSNYLMYAFWYMMQPPLQYALYILICKIKLLKYIAHSNKVCASFA